MRSADFPFKGLVQTVTPPPACTEFPYGLGKAGLHEVAEHTYGDRAAATGFVLANLKQQMSGALVWVRQAIVGLDHGDVPEWALPAGRPCLRLIVHTRTLREALWATEEAIVSGAASLVIAEVEGADFTATRRLALASGRHGVPAVLLLPYTCEGATAAATRWRVSPRPSAPNRYDSHAPGNTRWHATLERCRPIPSAAGQTFDLEWNDETLSLHLASGLAAGPAAPRPAASGAPSGRKTG